MGNETFYEDGLNKKEGLIRPSHLSQIWKETKDEFLPVIILKITINGLCDE